jgi:hypothetical protein
MILLFSSNAIAEFITITATGEVTSVKNTSIAIGTKVEYTFGFDLGLEGFELKDAINYRLDTDTYNSFYSDFISGYALQDYGVPSSVVERNYGYEYVDGSMSYLYGGVGSHYMRFSTIGNLSNLKVGSSMIGYERSLKTSNSYELIWTQLIVSDISTFSNVPECHVIVMMISGLFLLGTMVSIRGRTKKV